MHLCNMQLALKDSLAHMQKKIFICHCHIHVLYLLHIIITQLAEAIQTVNRIWPHLRVYSKHCKHMYYGALHGSRIKA